MDEIVNGGNLFGEGHVEGLKDICTLRDPKLSKALAQDAELVASKKMSLEEFKTKHAANLHHLIDPNHPDLGPKNNQFCLNWGRLKSGRSELLKRFVNNGLGSVNTHGHTTVCQGSLYFTCKAMSDQFEEGKWGGGKKFYWQADTGNAEFIIFVGSNPFEANYGPPLRAQKVTEGLIDGRLKIAVVDPRCSKTASRAWKRLPIEPNAVGALAMAMIHWVLRNQRFDARYLANANKAAAGAEAIHYGSAVLPGAMILTGRIGPVPILGVPACALHHKVTVFDLILPRILAGEEIGKTHLALMGHGGLCRDCPQCTYPHCPFGKGA